MRKSRSLFLWPRTGQGVRSALLSSRFARTPKDVRGIAWRISRDGSLCRERVVVVSGGRSSRRLRTGDGRRVAVSLPRTQSRTTTSALPPTTRWGLWRLVWCGASGRTSQRYRPQDLDLVRERAIEVHTCQNAFREHRNTAAYATSEDRTAQLHAHDHDLCPAP